MEESKIAELDLPPEVEQFVRSSSGHLRAISIRLDPDLSIRLEDLSARLNHPSRSAFLRYLVAVGIETVNNRISLHRELRDRRQASEAAAQEVNETRRAKLGLE